eukprot:3744434-Pleurochrysis_carterae.AAC.3
MRIAVPTELMRRATHTKAHTRKLARTRSAEQSTQIQATHAKLSTTLKVATPEKLHARPSITLAYTTLHARIAKQARARAWQLPRRRSHLQLQPRFEVAANPQRVGAANPQRVGAANPHRVGAANPHRVGAANPHRVGAANPHSVGAANPHR